MLRKIRIIVSLTIFSLLVFYFFDFSGILPQEIHLLTKIQLIPALLSLNWIVLAALLLTTLIFGRIYCSSICPLGVMQDISTWLARITSKKKKKFKFKKAHTVLRLSVLAVVLIAFLAGFSLLLGLLDPYGIFGRIVLHIFKPAYLAGNNVLADTLSASGGMQFYRVPIYFLSVSALVVSLFSLAVVGWMSWFRGRLYCNSICPVGTALGYVSKVALFKIRINDDLCNSCGACGRRCKANCIDTKKHAIDYSRCINCFDCIEVCNTKAMSFSYAMKPKQHAEKPDASKRQFLFALGAAGAGAGTLIAANTVPGVKTQLVPKLSPIMPPGALSIDNFSQKCISCHLCVSKCPAHVIRPSFLEYGLGGMMQPLLKYEDGFCNYNCTLCSDICPTGAILPQSVDQKHLLQIGRVQLELDKCIVITDDTNCGACSEHCPTQAVHMVPYKFGLTQPAIDADICVGCGGCEYICPARPQKAIYIGGVDKQVPIDFEIDREMKDIDVDDFGF